MILLVVKLIEEFFYGCSTSMDCRLIVIVCVNAAINLTGLSPQRPSYF